eukprot:262543-Chlamydomonas_euryale.AAC.2
MVGELVCTSGGSTWGRRASTHASYGWRACMHEGIRSNRQSCQRSRAETYASCGRRAHRSCACTATAGEHACAQKSWWGETFAGRHMMRHHRKAHPQTKT